MSFCMPHGAASRRCLEAPVGQYACRGYELSRLRAEPFLQELEAKGNSDDFVVLQAGRRRGRRCRTMAAVDVSRYQNEVSVVIHRTPQDLYEMVADVSRMAQWSPVCTGGRYDDDDREWFTGTNEMNGSAWETRCRVVIAAPGREFAFINHGLEGRSGSDRWTREQRRSRRRGGCCRRMPSASDSTKTRSLPSST